jgi:hypothetical protein
MRYSPSHPWDKPAQPPGQTDFPLTLQKKTSTINKELKTNTQQREQGAVSTLEKEEEQGADFHANFQ